VSIRFQLLIIALTTLLLPWAGCQYARELESTLRVSQEGSLQAAAGTIANALSAQAQRVFRDPEDVQPFDSAQGDLYVFPLNNEPLLDGYREDWDIAAGPSAMPGSGLPARIQAGFTEHYLFLYIEVDDPHFDPEPNDVHPERDRFDRVDLTLQRPDGGLETHFFATSAPGLIEAQSIVESDGIEHAALEPRIQAFWLQLAKGYHLEVRIPRSLVGPRLWVEASDGNSNARAGFMGADSSRGGRLFATTPGLGELLATFIGPGTRATVVDANDLKLGSAGYVSSNKDAVPAFHVE
jgi:two-component system sensor histidine kinase ChvG